MMNSSIRERAFNPGHVAEPSGLPAAPLALAGPAPDLSTRTVYLLLAVLYLLPGLIGHDPWKQDETYIADIVQNMLNTGRLLVPTMAGEPFMEKPPLYYWVAAASAWLFAPVLAIHDGARIANLGFIGFTCALLASTARRWWNPDHGGLAPLTLLACLGMELHAHLMLTDIAMLPGFALALDALARCRERPEWGGTLLGTGVGVGFLAKGMLAPGAIGICALLLPVCFPMWRRTNYGRALAIALLAALPWLLIWPIEVYRRSPALFMEWFWLNNVGRFLGFSVPMLGAAHDPRFWLHNLPWFTFPALPFALATLWRRRADLLVDPRLQLPLVLGAVLAAVLALAASARNNYALPLLLPLTLLAVPTIGQVPAMLDRSWDWASRSLFGSLAALICLVWACVALRGAAPGWPPVLGLLPKEFAASPNPSAFAYAVIATLALLTAGRHLLRGGGRGLYSWVIGMALCWALLSALLLPWINSAKSYRSVFDAFNAALPSSYRCIDSVGLGESERAMLDYYLGILTWRREAGMPHGCDLLLVNGFRAKPPSDVNAAHWALIWQGARPGDTSEAFWLYSAYPAQHATRASR